MMHRIFITCTFLLLAQSAYAYVGPGMAGGAVLAILAIFAALIISLWGILYYPLKRQIHKMADKSKEKDSEQDK